MAYTMTLSDGTKLEGLGLNGNNWISRKKLTEESFAGKLRHVEVTGDEDYVFEHAELVQVRKYGSAWWFVLRELGPEEILREKLRSDLDFVAMMTDIELEE